MEIIIKNSYEELSKYAAEFVKQRILKKPDLVLGLASGSTVLGMYKELIKMNLDFSKVCTFNVDEYVIDPFHPQSYTYYMWENFFKHINIKKENVFIPIDNPQEYEERIQEKGIDLQILGIGRNGHIGFNEPDSSIDSVTRIVSLDKTTIKDNSRFFNSISQVPFKAITMGIKTILQSKECLLLASGKNKKQAVKKALKGPITSEVPASYLQKHNNLFVVIDKEAGL